MATWWVLVADAGSARLFSAVRMGGDLTLMETFEHKESREKAIDLASDRAGRYQSRGSGHGAFTEASDPKTTEADRFARELAEKLNAGRVAKKYHQAALIAPATFLGRLKQHCNSHVMELIHLTLDKDYTRATEKELQRSLEIHRP